MTRVLVTDGATVTNVIVMPEGAAIAANHFDAAAYPNAAIGTPIIDGVPSPVAAVAPTKAELAAAAAAARWAYEGGGVDVGGTIIGTDETSQAKIAAAHAAFSDGTLTGSISFKALSGWIDADATKLAEIHTAVVAHVQAGYALERQAAAAIEAGTITDEAGVSAVFAASA